jgi:hypothetical protein
MIRVYILCMGDIREETLERSSCGWDWGDNIKINVKK